MGRKRIIYREVVTESLLSWISFGEIAGDFTVLSVT